MLSRLLRQVDVLRGGMQTTVQDLPGRVGLWEVGVPPSGPMDPASLRRANQLVGNPVGAAGLEITYAGPKLRFPGGALVAVCGAPVELTLDHVPVAADVPFVAPPGGTLDIGTIAGPGVRSYLAIRGGLDVPEVLGSRSTFLVGRLGGHRGRALQAGDRLPLGAFPETFPPTGEELEALTVPTPVTTTWTLPVAHGPHGAPDILSDEGLAAVLAQEWTVHRHADRAGIRLAGEGETRWARPDGGDAGLDPSNVIDCAYALGAVMITGGTPIIVAVDGPTLGGFAAPLCVTREGLWKVGQLRPGDTVRFVLRDDANVLIDAEAEAPPTGWPVSRFPAPAVLAHRPGCGRRPEVTYRRAGDTDVLLEYGSAAIDLAPRLRIHALQAALLARGTPGLRDLTPGVRSLQIRYDPDRLSLPRLMNLVQDLEADLGNVEDLEVPCRMITMPMAFDDRWSAEAVGRYQTDVRRDAPWCPDNVEFVRRINGLRDRDDVRRIMFDAAYVVLGLGDVYLGAPVALPLDPRHQLVTTKCTPPRTYTAEGGVGLGGGFLCIYGVDSPGGYQLVGRTVPIWARSGGDPDRPWLLRHFDHVRFEAVSDDELERLHERARDGHKVVRIEEHAFTLADRRRLEREHAREIQEHQRRRVDAFDKERRSWAA